MGLLGPRGDERGAGRRDHHLHLRFARAADRDDEQRHGQQRSRDGHRLRQGRQPQRLFGYRRVAALGAPNVTFLYDANGNLTSDGARNYLYDVENRLVSATGASHAELVYDPLGRLFQVSSGGAGIRRLVYDGDALVAEYDSAGNMPHRYIHGNDAGDDPLIWYDNFASGWRRALLTDHQGSVIQVADMYGNPIATNSYDPWGIPALTNAGRFGYTGQTWLPELGLWYYKARLYSPSLGRFLQTDPVGYEDHVNLYAYVDNDPLNKTDPTGRTGEQVARWAERMKGNKDYQFLDREYRIGGFLAPWMRATDLAGVGAPKCNFFVYDALKAGNTPQTRVNGRERIATASDWGNRKSQIDGFRPLGPGERPQRGDVVGNGGHVGIVVKAPEMDKNGHWANGLTASAASYGFGDQVTVVPFGFRDADERARVVFWRSGRH